MEFKGIREKRAFKAEASAITPDRLRNAADTAIRLNDFLDKCNEEGVLSLMGFDLDWLADQFEKAADRLGTPTENTP